MVEGCVPAISVEPIELFQETVIEIVSGGDGAIYLNCD